MSKLQYNLVPNVKGRAVDVGINNVRVFNAKHLLELYIPTGDKKPRYFGEAILKSDYKETVGMINEILKTLKNLNPDAEIDKNSLFDKEQELNYPVFYLRKDQDGNITKDFSISLQAYEKNPRNLFFEDIENKIPITDEREIKAHFWAVELRFFIFSDGRVGAVVKRLIKGKKANSSGGTYFNSEVFAGFNFEDAEEEITENDTFDDTEFDEPY